MFKNQKLTPKALKTRQRILEVAYSHFESQGFEQSTMRGIAKELGISAGGIYHYFPTKEHMVQQFYEELHEPHEKLCVDILKKHKKLEDRIREVVLAKIQLAQPNHELSKALFRVASDPQSSLSPFSDESKKTREKSLKIFTEIVEGSTDKLPKDLREILPTYLWLYQMGVILFWMYDKTPKAHKTEKFILKSTKLVGSLVDMTKNPILSPFRKGIVNLLKEFQPHLGELK